MKVDMILVKPYKYLVSTTNMVNTVNTNTVYNSDSLPV